MSTMTWDDVMANPYLKDLPFKIELNKWGRIEMSPASNADGLRQAECGMELGRRRDGSVLFGCSIATSDGVSVADVAWVSNERRREFGDATPFPRAPEVCVEIKSPTLAAMLAKAALYVEAGAQEVWIVGLDGERRVIRA